jgi:hypothetical protein
MAGQSVQFFGRAAVLNAYRARGIDTWGLFDKKQFINAGQDENDLSAFLEMLEPGGSQSVYTLKVYRDVDDIDLLTDRTECNGSFNFKLFQAMAPASLAPATVGNPSPGARYADPIYQKIHGIIDQEVSAAIEKRLSGKSQDEEEEKEQSWNEVIMGYVNSPEKLNAVLPVIQSTLQTLGAIFRPGGVAPAAVGIPVSLAGTQPVQRVGAVQQPTNDEKLARLAAALDKWESLDPDALTVIEKIVALAENDPGKYKMAKSFL